MSWIDIHNRSIFREQRAIFVLMMLMTAIFFAQLITEFHWNLKVMTVPEDVVYSWNQLREGQFGSADLLTFGTLISAAFLHGDFSHLAGNMLFFWVFGGLLNELLGWRWLLLIFLMTAIGGSATQVAMNAESTIPMLGVSGVVSGFAGAYLGLWLRWHLPNPHIWPISHPVPPANLGVVAIILIGLDYRSIFKNIDCGIAYGAHVGGFTMGLFLTSFLIPRPKEAQPRG